MALKSFERFYLVESYIYDYVPSYSSERQRCIDKRWIVVICPEKCEYGGRYLGVDLQSGFFESFSISQFNPRNVALSCVHKLYYSEVRFDGTLNVTPPFGDQYGLNWLAPEEKKEELLKICTPEWRKQVYQSLLKLEEKNK
jgi:hypothetical protein